LRGLTIVVPALNEEAYIAQTVGELVSAARRVLDAFEIILVDDGSTDMTGKIADELAVKDPEIQVIHNRERRGVGWAFWEGIARSRFEYLTVVPGDHAYQTEALIPFFKAIGTADLVISYRTNQLYTRRLVRAFLSGVYQRLMRLVFGFGLRDFHSTVIYPVNLLRRIGMRSLGYTYQLEALVRLLSLHKSFVEIPVSLNFNRHSSDAIQLKTLCDVARTIWRLKWQKRQESTETIK